MGVKLRKDVANYLNVAAASAEAEDFAFMGTGFVDLNDSPSAQTTSKKYVNNASATKSIVGYDWSAPYTMDQIREEKAIDYMCKIGEDELTGAAAETDYVKVELTKKIGVSGTEFEARKRKVAIEVAEFSNNDGELQGSGNLLGISDWVKGKFDTSTRKFTVVAE